MTLRSFFLALLAFVVVCLSIAGGGVTWVLAQSPLNLQDGGVQKTPTAAMFVPKQSPAMVSLLVNPSRLEALLQAQVSLGQRKATRQEVQEIKSGLLGNTKLRYNKDILPWLGEEITVAVTSLDYDRNPENGQQPGYLLIAAAKDGEYAREFLQLFYSKTAIAGEADLVFEQYKGVNLIYRRLRESGETPLASAVVGDRYVLFANSPKVLRDAVNNVQVPDLNLEHFGGYQQALETIESPRVGVAYINLLSVAKAFETNPTEPVPTVTLSFQLSEQGLVADSALSGVVNPEATQPRLTAPVGALSYLPPKSILTASGLDLKGFWGQILTRFGEESPVTGLFEGAIAKLESNWNLDLPQEIFAWVEGEYALSLVPKYGSGQPDWVFVAQNSGDSVEDAIAHLDDLAEEQELSVGTLALGDQNVKVWTKLAANTGRVDANVKGVHTQVGDYELLSSSLDAVETVLNPKMDSLLESQQFQNAISPLPQPNHGYLYIDWTQCRPLLEQQFPALRVLDYAAKPLLDRLDSLTLTSQGSENGVSRATALLQIAID
ncbi:DUF3352 domain-containing protein [Spirulina sp. CS-785/01]|uniref:DUF3352 domain-containing protein n=1 Tax=Spirulina sp. CS-785/01 TaxID=3021716 RepID=UPI00232D92C1|nr:DUF3352 domain-containing protein [Spirulina sp. CS-785/01]MDB9314466.1 DUF3352 domain-containing protein [Spirulina sp. CS-785/01]